MKNEIEKVRERIHHLQDGQMHLEQQRYIKLSVVKLLI